MKSVNTIFFKPSISNLTYVFGGILLNFIGALIANKLDAPFFLDSIGTVLCACLFGPIAGCIVGVFSFLLYQMLHPVFWLYAIICIPVSICASIAYRKMSFSDVFQLISSGFLTALASLSIRYLLDWFFRQGHIENLWGDSLIIMLQQNNGEPLINDFIGHAFIEIPDKVLTICIAYLLLLCRKKLKQYNKRGDD